MRVQLGHIENSVDGGVVHSLLAQMPLPDTNKPAKT